jgi:hypothetical protein
MIPMNDVIVIQTAQRYMDDTMSHARSGRHFCCRVSNKCQ